jgi:hypothetical protein
MIQQIVESARTPVEAWSESNTSSMRAAIFWHDENCTLVDDEVNLKQMDLVEAI